jgi:uncharacterized protein with GYD domain
MPRYLVSASYTTEGAKGLLKGGGGTARRSAIQQLAQSIGGELESMYFAFGEDDVYVIFEAPDNISAAAVALTVNAAGAAKTKTTVLLTPEEVDRAAKKTVAYRPPGQ